MIEKKTYIIENFSGSNTIYQNKKILLNILLLTIAFFITLVAPYIGALVCSAIVIIFPRNYFLPYILFAFVGLVFTTASKQVGIDLSEDFARYFDIYKQYAETSDIDFLYSSFKPWEVGLPTLYLICASIFGDVGEQQLLLIFSVITLISAIGSSIFVAHSLQLGLEQKRILIGMTLLLFPVLVSTQLLRQYFAGLLIFAAWFSRNRSLKWGLSLIGLACHTSALAIMLGLFVSVSWKRLLLFSIIFTLLFSQAFIESYLNITALNLLSAIESNDSNNTGSIIRATLIFMPCIFVGAILKSARWAFEFRIFLYALLMLAIVPNQEIAFRLSIPYFDIALGLLIGIIICQFKANIRLCLIIIPFLLSLYSGRFVEGAFLWQQYEPFSWPAKYIYIYL